MRPKPSASATSELLTCSCKVKVPLRGFACHLQPLKVAYLSDLAQTGWFFKPRGKWGPLCSLLPWCSHMDELWLVTVRHRLVWQKVIPDCLRDWVWEDLAMLTYTLKRQQRSQIWETCCLVYEDSKTFADVCRGPAAQIAELGCTEQNI